MNIRSALPEDYDALAHIWLESWYSTGLKTVFDPGLEMLRKRIPEEVAKGWTLYAAQEPPGIVAMLALHPRDFYLDQLWVAPAHQGRGIGRACSHSRAGNSRTKSGCVAWWRIPTPGPGMSAKVSAVKAKKSSRRPTCG